MINDKKVLGIIPARGGSKGLPGKNIKPLCGKPLIAWSIEAGLASEYIDELMVSTENQKIRDLAIKCGSSAPFLRPKHLASDTALTVDAVKHVIQEYRKNIKRQFDYIVLLEPTSPLRERNDIDLMLEKLERLSDQYDGIVSIGKVHEHPSIMMRIINNSIESYCEELTVSTRRQDCDAAYFPYGVAYISKTLTLLQEGTFYPLRTTYHVIKRYQCYEIDDIYDFMAVENVMKFEWGKK